MDNSFEKVQEVWCQVDLACEKVEQADFYTEDLADALQAKADRFLETIKVWRHQHGD